MFQTRCRDAGGFKDFPTRAKEAPVARIWSAWGHLPNSLDGLRVAFLLHFFTFAWRQPSVKGQIFVMKPPPIPWFRRKSSQERHGKEAHFCWTFRKCGETAVPDGCGIMLLPQCEKE